MSNTSKSEDSGENRNNDRSDEEDSTGNKVSGETFLKFLSTAFHLNETIEGTPSKEQKTSPDKLIALANSELFTNLLKVEEKCMIEALNEAQEARRSQDYSLEVAIQRVNAIREKYERVKTCNVVPVSTNPIPSTSKYLPLSEIKSRLTYTRANVSPGLQEISDIPELNLDITENSDESSVSQPESREVIKLESSNSTVAEEVETVNRRLMSQEFDVDRIIKNKLGEVLQEGILDSVLPYLTGRYRQISSSSTQGPAVRKVIPIDSRKLTDKPMTINLQPSKKRSSTDDSSKKGTDCEVEIHVCDEAKNLKKDFRCSQKLLVSKMGYFAHVTIGKGQRLEDMDISVHCDINIFEWLMQWVRNELPADVTPEAAAAYMSSAPDLDISNVIPIMVSASFLQMSPLLDICLIYCKINMNEILKSSANLSCLNEIILTRLADMYSNEEAEMIRDKRDKIKSRIYCKLITFLSQPEPDRSKGHFFSLANLYKCVHCSKLILPKISKSIPCNDAWLKLFKNGKILFLHERNPSWNLTDYIDGLKNELRCWRRVYWRLWSECHFMYCATCECYFSLYNFYTCTYHPESSQFFSMEQQRSTTYPVGRYPCCGIRAYRFESVNVPKRGCRSKRHTPSYGGDAKQLLKMFENYQSLFVSEQTSTSSESTARPKPSTSSAKQDDDFESKARNNDDCDWVKYGVRLQLIPTNHSGNRGLLLQGLDMTQDNVHVDVNREAAFLSRELISHNESSGDSVFEFTIISNWNTLYTTDNIFHNFPCDFRIDENFDIFPIEVETSTRSQERRETESFSGVLNVPNYGALYDSRDGNTSSETQNPYSDVVHEKSKPVTPSLEPQFLLTGVSDEEECSESENETESLHCQECVENLDPEEHVQCSSPSVPPLDLVFLNTDYSDKDSSDSRHLKFSKSDMPEEIHLDRELNVSSMCEPKHEIDSITDTQRELTPPVPPLKLTFVNDVFGTNESGSSFAENPSVTHFTNPEPISDFNDGNRLCEFGQINKTFEHELKTLHKSVKNLFEEVLDTPLEETYINEQFFVDENNQSAEDLNITDFNRDEAVTSFHSDDRNNFQNSQECETSENEGISDLGYYPDEESSEEVVLVETAVHGTSINKPFGKSEKDSITSKSNVINFTSDETTSDSEDESDSLSFQEMSENSDGEFTAESDYSGSSTLSIIRSVWETAWCIETFILGLRIPLLDEIKSEEEKRKSVSDCSLHLTYQNKEFVYDDSSKSMLKSITESSDEAINPLQDDGNSSQDTREYESSESSRIGSENERHELSSDELIPVEMILEETCIPKGLHKYKRDSFEPTTKSNYSDVSIKEIFANKYFSKVENSSSSATNSNSITNNSSSLTTNTTSMQSAVSTMGALSMETASSKETEQSMETACSMETEESMETAKGSDTFMQGQIIPPCDENKSEEEKHKSTLDCSVQITYHNKEFARDESCKSVLTSIANSSDEVIDIPFEKTYSAKHSDVDEKNQFDSSNEIIGMPLEEDYVNKNFGLDKNKQFVSSDEVTESPLEETYGNNDLVVDENNQFDSSNELIDIPLEEGYVNKNFGLDENNQSAEDLSVSDFTRGEAITSFKSDDRNNSHNTQECETSEKKGKSDLGCYPDEELREELVPIETAVDETSINKLFGKSEKDSSTSKSNVINFTSDETTSDSEDESDSLSFHEMSENSDCEFTTESDYSDSSTLSIIRSVWETAWCIESFILGLRIPLSDEIKSEEEKRKSVSDCSLHLTYQNKEFVYDDSSKSALKSITESSDEVINIPLQESDFTEEEEITNFDSDDGNSSQDTREYESSESDRTESGNNRHELSSDELIPVEMILEEACSTKDLHNYKRDSFEPATKSNYSDISFKEIFVNKYFGKVESSSSSATYPNSITNNSSSLTNNTTSMQFAVSTEGALSMETASSKEIKQSMETACNMETEECMETAKGSRNFMQGQIIPLCEENKFEEEKHKSVPDSSLSGTPVIPEVSYLYVREEILSSSDSSYCDIDEEIVLWETDADEMDLQEFMYYDSINMSKTGSVIFSNQIEQTETNTQERKPLEATGTSHPLEQPAPEISPDSRNSGSEHHNDCGLTRTDKTVAQKSGAEANVSEGSSSSWHTVDDSNEEISDPDEGDDMAYSDGGLSAQDGTDDKFSKGLTVYNARPTNRNRRPKYTIPKTQWVTRFSTRYNQDNQRDYEERSFHSINSMLGHRMTNTSSTERLATPSTSDSAAVPNASAPALPGPGSGSSQSSTASTSAASGLKQFTSYCDALGGVISRLPNAPSSRPPSYWRSHSPLGGSYVKIEADWRDVHNIQSNSSSSSSSVSSTNTNSTRTRATGSRGRARR